MVSLTLVNSYIVSGSVSSWLCGTLNRDGPGKLHHGGHYYHHLFDGDALVQAFRVTPDGITYFIICYNVSGSVPSWLCGTLNRDGPG